jgi:hypothetical protein
MAGAACRRGSGSTASDLLDVSAVVADAVRRAAHLPSHQLIGGNLLTQPQVHSTSLASP